MKIVRRCHVVILLAWLVDLVNPVMPGVFSLVHHGLFMDGVTRAHASGDTAACLRGTARVRTSVDLPRAEAAATADDDGAQAARRPPRHRDARRTLHPTVAPRATDTEDN